MTSDPRVTPGLIHDIVDALQRHGYYRSDDQHADRAIGLIGDLAGIYEGTQDHPAYPFTVPPPAYPGCARSFKMRMMASFAVRMCGRGEGLAGGSRRGLGVRGGVVVVSLT